ncbi:caspase family protein [Rosistilla carotiformis]|nr:caspase family protein [Rosistilla carotiformis]
MMTPKIRIAIPLLLLVSLASVSVAAENTKLHAMVIGNGEYKIGKLANPSNDAHAMSAALSELGFKVTTETDLTHHNMDRAITKFCQQVDEGGLAFFFFAGHGIQVDGENYLIPIDAEIPDQSFVKYKAVSLSLILDSLGKSRSNMNVVVLDCCRNNPFERTWSTRSLGQRGLAAQNNIPEGTIIAYATSPGKTAADGDAGNSPYTTELTAALKQRPRTGLLLRDVFFTASRAVKEKTGQSPWVNMEASLDNFYLHPSEGDETASVPRPEPEVELEVIPAGLAKPEPMAAAPVPAKPSISLEDKTLFDQAEVYLRQGKYDNAIMAYTAILESDSLSPASRQKARKSRGAAYLGRGTKKDLNYGIIDQLAAGLDGIRVTVRTDAADLKVGTSKSGYVSRGQVLLITKSMEHNALDWFWVAAVNGDETLKGWVPASAVVKSDDSSKPASLATSATPRHPASSGLLGSGSVSESLPRPQSSQPQPHVVQTPSTPSWQDNRSAIPQSQSGFSPSRNSGVTSNSVVRQQQTPMQPQSNGWQGNAWRSNSNHNNLQGNTQSWNNNQGMNLQSNNRWQGGNNNNNWGHNNHGSGNGGMRSNSGAKSIWATPKWETPAEIRRGIANGTLRW